MTYLTSVPEDILRHLNGYYLGWIRNNIGEVREKATLIDNTWHKAVISVLPYDHKALSPTSVAGKYKKFAVFLFQDHEEQITLNSQVEVQAMGFIRPPDQFIEQQHTETVDVAEAKAETAIINTINDVEIAQAFLGQPAWGPKSSINVMQSRNLGPVETVKSSYVDTRMALQRHIDRILLHKVGIRSPADRFRGEAIRRGGVYVRR
jgi:hypothetical protein